MASRGIIYEYEDGGKYCGEWENDAAHGHGVCTGPDGNGLFEGLWERGNQASGVFTWPSGQKYMGKWRQGVREGVGKETKRDGTEYCGEFTRDSRGPYGVLRQPNGVVYRGTWSEGVQYGEGTELYIDGGMYRGEYRSGLRHGHGTRSSSSYEQSTTKDSHSVHSSVDDSVENLASALEDPSSNFASMAANKSNAQIYEGEWKDDKRHGYGVLKIVGYHTYYGQWKDNMRSGYGVMIYGEEKRKEEGQWQRGKLVQELKRRKLPLKTRQLEAKVNQAHMCALQSAETARNKADLAEGRASTANAKSRQAVRAAQQAAKDAETAQGIEKLHRNAPKIQEHYKSPVTRSFSTEQGSLDPNKYSNLLVPSNIPVTPSFEDLASIASGRVSSTVGTENSSGSSESIEETLTATEMERTSQLPALRSHENPSPELWKRKQLDVKSKRKMFQSLRHSSGDVRLHNEEIDDDRIRFNVARTVDVKEKGKFLMKVRQTGPDLTFGSHPAVDNERGEGWKRSSSSSAVIPESASEGDQVSNGAGSDLRPRHINKATGEPDHGEATDEEESPTVKLKPAPEKHHAPQSVSVEVLQQMAQWNKMVAYLNLALLFFLILLVITVVICMNYYWIVYQMSPSQAAPTYLSGPMA